MENREIRQREALTAIEKAGFHASIKACVGFGKTILAQRVLKRMLDKGELMHGNRILFQTSATNLLEAFFLESKLCEELFGFNIFDELDISMACYQSKVLETGVFDYVINDEVDFCGDKLGEPISKYRGRMLNMSGTMSTKNMVDNQTKVQWIESLAPIVFDYPIEKGIEEGILVNFETTLFKHELGFNKYGNLFKNQKHPFSEVDFYMKSIEMKDKFRFVNMAAVNEEVEKRMKKVTGSPSFLTTEAKRIKDEVIKAHEKKNKFLFQLYGTKGSKMLQELNSKVPHLKRLIRSLYDQKKRVLLWAPYLDYLESIVGPKFVYREGRDDIKDAFQNKEIHLIATSKKLLRGFTPNEIDVLIMCNPMGSIVQFEQLLGRTVRTDKRPDKVAQLYIIYTEDTYEENWLRRGTVENNRVLDLNIKHTKRLADVD